jgi:hypothetical protein
MTRAAPTACTRGRAATGAEVVSGGRQAGGGRAVLRQCIDVYCGVGADEVAGVASAALVDRRAIRVDRARLVVARSSNDWRIGVADVEAARSPRPTILESDQAAVATDDARYTTRVEARETLSTGCQTPCCSVRPVAPRLGSAVVERCAVRSLQGRNSSFGGRAAIGRRAATRHGANRKAAVQVPADLLQPGARVAGGHARTPLGDTPAGASLTGQRASGASVALALLGRICAGLTGGHGLTAAGCHAERQPPRQHPPRPHASIVALRLARARPRVQALAACRARRRPLRCVRPGRRRAGLHVAGGTGEDSF